MDKATLSLLKLFNERHSLSLIQLGAILNIDYFTLLDPVHYMMEQKYICKGNAALLEHLEGDTISPDTPLEITYFGRISIKQAKKEHLHFKYIEFRAWMTLIIAIMAFLKSFFF